MQPVKSTPRILLVLFGHFSRGTASPLNSCITNHFNKPPLRSADHQRDRGRSVRRFPCCAYPVDLMVFGLSQKVVQNVGSGEYVDGRREQSALSGECLEAMDLVFDGSLQLRQESLATRGQQ